jgi:hypothetical protein
MSYFNDIAVMKQQGADLRDLIAEGGYQLFFDLTTVVPRELTTEDPALIEGFGRGLARASDYGFQNPDEILAMTNEECPEEASDAELTNVFLNGITDMMKLPAAANGKWGFADPGAVSAYIDFLVASGDLSEPADPALFTNQFVDAYNDF